MTVARGLRVRRHFMRRWAALPAAFAIAACAGASPSGPAIPAQPPVAPSANAPPPSVIAPTGSSTAIAAPAPPPRIALLSTSAPSCGLDVDGQEWTWHRGVMEKTSARVPNATSYACDLAHACASTTGGEAYCWGQNSYGKLGDGTETHRDLPTRVVGLSDVAEIGAAGDRTCARTRGGDIYCWGDSEFGKAGDGRLPDNSGREKVRPGPAILTGATSLAVGSVHACSLLRDGRLSCWGQNLSGATGQPLATRNVGRPKIATNIGAVASVHAGSGITCAIDRAGAVSCWGALASLVGPPTSPGTHLVKPVAFALPGPAAEVAIGWESVACARLVSGGVLCWGSNDAGQLGDGTKKDRAIPAPVTGLPADVRVQRVAAEGERACALLADGRVFCWGKDVPNGGATSRALEIRVER